MTCAICGEPRILTKCVECARRVCYDCHARPANLCSDCAARHGIHMRGGPRLWTAH